MMNANDRYDAIIIGAGLGGLSCGCFLARAGLHVLILEQHTKPGGCCTSFKRLGLTFDSAPHCFGSFRKDGLTRRILEDLGVDKKLTIIRPNPTDSLITPDFKISFWTDLERTTSELQSLFPAEADNIRNFFSFLLHADANAFSRIRSWTFRTLLDSYFNNEKLKFIFSAPLLGFNGLPPSLMSAFVGSKIFSEFLLDGGYYPNGGMQALPDAMAATFRELGGELRLSSLVTKIATEGNSVTGVVIGDHDLVRSKYVISDCDAKQTFSRLLPQDIIDPTFLASLNNMIPSMSNFIMYAGIDSALKADLNPGTTVCFFPHYDLEAAYQAAAGGDLIKYGGFSTRISHDRKTLGGLIPAPFKTMSYWKMHKQPSLDSFIERIEKSLIPGLNKHITYKEAASPQTIYRYTLNYNGASYGWAGITSQFACPDYRKPSFAKNLFLTSHWTTLGVGISGVIFFGYDTAKLIAKKERLKIQ